MRQSTSGHLKGYRVNARTSFLINDSISSCIDALRRQCLVVVPFLNSYSSSSSSSWSSTKSHSFNTQFLLFLPRSHPSSKFVQISWTCPPWITIDPLGFHFPKSLIHDHPRAILSISGIFFKHPYLHYPSSKFVQIL